MSHNHRSRRTIVLRYQTRAYQSDTTVVDQRPPPHRLTPIKRKPPRHQTGAAFTCLLTNHAYISAVLVMLLDRLGHYQPAATISGFAATPYTRSVAPEMDTAVTHLRGVLGEDDY